MGNKEMLHNISQTNTPISIINVMLKEIIKLIIIILK